MKGRGKAVLFLATGFGSGCVPTAPGTFGTAAGLPLCFALSRMPTAAAAAACVVLIAAAVWIAHEGRKYFGRHDPGAIVIDEIAGIAVTLWGLPFTPGVVVAGFVLFRVLDILKPFPIGAVDRHVHGGVGIVADDVVAGVAANLLLRAGLLLAA